MIKTGIYQHYKGKLYQVIGLARHSENLEELVVYQSMYGDYGLWTRPLKMFTEDILIDGKNVPRFRFLSDPATKAPEFRT